MAADGARAYAYVSVQSLVPFDLFGVAVAATVGECKTFLVGFNTNLVAPEVVEQVAIGDTVAFGLTIETGMQLAGLSAVTNNLVTNYW